MGGSHVTEGKSQSRSLLSRPPETVWPTVLPVCVASRAAFLHAYKDTIFVPPLIRGKQDKACRLWLQCIEQVIDWPTVEGLERLNNVQRNKIFYLPLHCNDSARGLMVTEPA